MKIRKIFGIGMLAALMDYVQSDSHSLQDRNHAVWALGQCRDERAAPVLQALLTGEDCDHEHEICQYELIKALDLSSPGALNILAIQTSSPAEN